LASLALGEFLPLVQTDAVSALIMARVLYLHPAASFGGASKSLIELFNALKDTDADIEGVILTPEGSASQAFSDAGMQVRSIKGLAQFDNTRYGYYRGIRWLILMRELFLLPFSLMALWRLRRERFDLLHVNEITLLPLSILAKRLLKIPMVVHVRSLQRKTGYRTRLLGKLLALHADAIVAIDCTVASTLAGIPNVEIVHNGLRMPLDLPEKVHTPGSAVRVGFLGVLIPLKGIYELIEAIRILKARGLNVECLVAGENARKLSGIKAWLLKKLGFAKDVHSEVQVLINKYDLESQVKLIGFVKDVSALYSRLDVLCFPSHLDAAGRPVFEAAFHGVPSVVAVRDPLPDTVLHGVTGLAVASPAPALIADALEQLARDEPLRKEMGMKARDWAQENFSIASNAARMALIYQRLLDTSAKDTH
jgi:glycosyltransferase involved in cell wall biosynthesis